MQCPSDESAANPTNIQPDRRAPVQGECIMRAGRVVGMSPDGTIAWAEHLEAFERYATQHGREQSAERIAARGGFGINELRILLGREPSTFEASNVGP
jgi:hypothetical protein